MASTASAGLQDAATAVYARVPYPPMVHTQNHPDRLAVIARLAGMAPPDIRTARVLEVGVGNGLNLMSLAQAFPDAHFTGIDIDPVAIGEGSRLREAAGLTNARLDVLDLLDAAGKITGAFDYIIAHGVLAWVPPTVAAALLALVGRHLAPDGVAMVSFNALPGCYLRQAMRDTLLQAIAGIDDPEAQLERAYAVLAAIAEPRDGDSAAQIAYRAEARRALDRDPGVLLHDELCADWHPLYLGDVLADAVTHDLAFLGDATPDRLAEALTSADEAANQQAVEARARAADQTSFCLFRRLLLIRPAAIPSRIVATAAVEALFASSNAGEPEPGTFVDGVHRVEMAHPVLTAMMRRLIAARPDRVPVRDLGLSPELVAPLLRLFDNGLIDLHTVEAPFATSPGECPRSSPLARAMLARGGGDVATLAHVSLRLDPPVADAVMALDGTDKGERFDARVAAAGLTRAAALANLAGCALLMRPA